MRKEDLLFYSEYESFYEMAGKSKAFKNFCIEAFGEDFSQDGFSDINQVNMILPYIPTNGDAHILDIGCGNGKMLKYLQSKSSCSIYGFDYSKKAIETANLGAGDHADFREGIMGEIEYPDEFFDVITSMDTMYFAKDMSAFVGQIKKWLKKGGTIFVAYQEGDVMPKTEDAHTTELSKAFRNNSLSYEVTDITKQTYDMLRKKRQVANNHKDEFLAEGNEEWFDMLMWQTECATDTFEQFAKEMSRYIYIVKK